MDSDAGFPTKKRAFRLRAGWLAALCVIFVLGFRLGGLSCDHVREAQQALAAQQDTQAVEACTWAIRNHFPGNPYSARAVALGLGIADRLVEEGRINEARRTWLDLRATLLSIRSFYQPFPDVLNQIDRRLDHETNSP